MNPLEQYNMDLILRLSAQAMGYLHEAEPSLQSQVKARTFVQLIQQIALEMQKPLDANTGP